MPIEANRQQNLNKILNLISALDDRFTPDALELAFVNRAIDSELAEIGALDIGADKPDHILAFRGYEIIKNSPYIAV